ncbi:uncharacterized protein LOC142321955 [Lycorma delicatula]|uniref:uncharacterized protein LOC142321955 n=1 Tax=Lycorma delicatula TaxID=130591 RepID=UPI003F514623
MIQYLFFASIVVVSGTSAFSLNSYDYTLKYTEALESCDKSYSCLNCTTVQICKKYYNGTVSKKYIFQCPSSNPYCDIDSGACRSTSKDPTCAPISHEFICSEDGYYPNPTNCRKYYICVKGVAYSFDCSNIGTGYYNSKSQNCEYQYSCYYISCYGKSGVKVPYPYDSSYYGYCYNDELITFEKCPGSFQLDTVKGYCVPVCSEEGYQGDPYDCSKYYKCSYETSSYILTLKHNKCPKDQLFDSVNEVCSPKRKGLKCASGKVYDSTE